MSFSQGIINACLTILSGTQSYNKTTLDMASIHYKVITKDVSALFTSANDSHKFRAMWEQWS